jgi:hypothetical protein
VCWGKERIRVCSARGKEGKGKEGKGKEGKGKEGKGKEGKGKEGKGKEGKGKEDYPSSSHTREPLFLAEFDGVLLTLGRKGLLQQGLVVLAVLHLLNLQLLHQQGFFDLPLCSLSVRTEYCQRNMDR